MKDKDNNGVYRWTRPVHEVLEYTGALRLRQFDGPVGRGVVNHDGFGGSGIDEGAKRRKGGRDVRLLVPGRYDAA